MRTIAVVDNIKDWILRGADVELVTAQDYLSNPTFQSTRSLRVLNLCRSYAYQRLGYYVSLIATARGHKPEPSQLCIEDLKSDSMIRMASKELDEIVQKSLKHLEGSSFILSIYFGKPLAKCHSKLATYLARQFPAPFLQARFSRVNDKWMIVNIYPLPIGRIPEDHLDFVSEQAQKYLSEKIAFPKQTQKAYRYDLAILVDPKDPNPPSNPAAIQQFLKSAERMGFATEILGPTDLGRIAEFDALFIRETTMVNHHTFHFARKAAAQGLVVIDDPHSILRCGNKIFLSELLHRHKLPTPHTAIVSKGNLDVRDLPRYPFVLKRPDGCFSNGVTLVKDREEFAERSDEYFKSSDLLITQEFVPSTFDWRIGILNNNVIYVCKYYMVTDHWQIIRKASRSKKTEEGASEAVPLSQLPTKAKNLALKVAGLIGNGLYGVDIKEVDGKFYIIEINDNPSIDAGCEDALLGERLYDDIIGDIRRRVESVGYPVKT